MRFMRPALGGVLALACASCLSCSFQGIRGSGVLVTKAYDFKDFTAVTVGSVFHAEISRGESFDVKVTVDDNLLEYLRVEQQGTTVAMGLGNVSLRDATLKAQITMPALERLEAGGVTQVELKGFEGGPSLTLDVGGVSRVWGSAEAADVKISCGGVSHVTLRGSARTLQVDVNGTSQVDLGDFPASDARAHVHGCSKASINARERLDYDVEGVSTLTYAGSPTMGSQTVSGCSRVAPR